MNKKQGFAPENGANKPISSVSDESLSESGDDMKLDPKVLATIGRSLKAHYDDLIGAPVPDKFLLLLAKLEEKERRHDN